jgi:uncharacterized protein YcbX
VKLIRIARYPVKSLQGELLSEAEIELNGLRGDRCWGIRDERTGKVLTARRAPEMLFASATLASDATPVITLPTGVVCNGPGGETDAALSEWLAKPVRLVSPLGLPPARAEFFADATDDTSEAIEWTMPADRFVDAQPLLLLTTASLHTAAALHPEGDWDPRRFRANLLVEVAGEGWIEDTWCGVSTVRIGGVHMQPRQPCVRCTMVTRAQPGLEEDRDTFRVLARHHGGLFGAWTTVSSGGTVHVGDDVRVEPNGFADSSGRPRIIAQRAGTEDEPRSVDPV